MSYHGILGNWRNGVHDCRGYGYQHPWLAVDNKSNSVAGCWSRAEARQAYKDLKRYGRRL